MKQMKSESQMIVKKAFFEIKTIFIIFDFKNN
jgi:hypothetical protein